MDADKIQYPLNLQQSFEVTWQRFVVEKKRQSYDQEAGCCKYTLTKSGRCRCAIGWLLPLKLCLKLNQFMAGGLMSGDIWPLVKEFFTPDIPTPALCDLQAIHDQCHTPFSKNIEAGLRRFAESHQLTIPVAPVAPETGSSAEVAP